MRISELIAELQKVIEADGDMEGVEIGSDGCVYIPSKQWDNEEGDE